MLIWQLIEELVREERECLALQGYTKNLMLEAIVGGVDAAGNEQTIGCTVSAMNDAGRTVRSDVFYPEDWREREQRERACLAVNK